MQKGGSPNARNGDDSGLLNESVKAKNFSLVKLLLWKGADPNRRCDNGWTPLELAKNTGDKQIIYVIEVFAIHSKSPGGRKAAMMQINSELCKKVVN